MPLELIRREPTPGARYGNRVNWGSIFAGAIVTVASVSLFLLLGSAVGLTAENVTSDTASVAGRTWSWIYTLGTMLVSAYVGGYFTSRLAGMPRRGSGSMHAICAFAVAGLSMLSYGIALNPTIRDSLIGTGPSGIEWLMFLFAVGGSFLSGVGGANGTHAAHEEITGFEGQRPGMPEEEEGKRRTA